MFLGVRSVDWKKMDTPLYPSSHQACVGSSFVVAAAAAAAATHTTGAASKSEGGGGIHIFPIYFLIHQTLIITIKSWTHLLPM